jgi:hypothetical protein
VLMNPGLRAPGLTSGAPPFSRLGREGARIGSGSRGAGVVSIRPLVVGCDCDLSVSMIAGSRYGGTPVKSQPHIDLIAA